MADQKMWHFRITTIIELIDDLECHQKITDSNLIPITEEKAKAILARGGFQDVLIGHSLITTDPSSTTSTPTPKSPLSSSPENSSFSQR